MKNILIIIALVFMTRAYYPARNVVFDCEAMTPFGTAFFCWRFGDNGFVNEGVGFARPSDWEIQ